LNLAVHFIRARSSLILSYSSESFLLYYTTWRVRGKKRIVVRRGEGGGIDRSSIIGKMVFHILFML